MKTVKDDFKFSISFNLSERDFLSTTQLKSKNPTKFLTSPPQYFTHKIINRTKLTKPEKIRTIRMHGINGNNITAPLSPQHNTP